MSGEPGAAQPCIGPGSFLKAGRRGRSLLLQSFSLDEINLGNNSLNLCFLPGGDFAPWHLTLLAVIPGRSYWPPVGRSQECCSASYKAQDTPPPQRIIRPKCQSPDWETWFILLQLKVWFMDEKLVRNAKSQASPRLMGSKSAVFVWEPLVILYAHYI